MGCSVKNAAFISMTMRQGIRAVAGSAKVKFKNDDLYDLINDESVSDTNGESRRWVTPITTVFAFEGKHYEHTWESGNTEYQDDNYCYDNDSKDPNEFTECEEVELVEMEIKVKRWMPVTRAKET